MEDLVCSKLNIQVSKSFDANLCAISSHINMSFLLFQPNANYSAWHRKLNYSLQQGLKFWTSHHYKSLKSSIFFWLHHSFSLGRDSHHPQVKSCFWPNELCQITELVRSPQVTSVPTLCVYTDRYRQLKLGKISHILKYRTYSTHSIYHTYF